MALREFTDHGGVHWTVWDVLPQLEAESTDTRVHARLPPEYVDGWLIFESHTERRRFAPIPDEWDTFGDDRLARLCDLAEKVSNPGRLIE